MQLKTLAGKKVWIAGDRGLVGSALVRRLSSEDCTVLVIGRELLDLRRQADVEAFVLDNRPDAIVMAAAKVGGIQANDSQPAEFLYDNLMIAANIFGAAHRADVPRVVFIGSSSAYPRHAPQPVREESLLTGDFESTHQWYATAKIAGIKLAQAYRKQWGRDYIVTMPTNLYGPGDKFDLATGHVVPALIRKAHEAKLRGDSELVVWGTGTPRREFLHCDDCADALVFLLKTYSGAEPVNIGSGEDLTILDLTRLVCEVVGFKGQLVHDLSKPDGPDRKLMSADKLRAMGWRPSITLEDGLRQTYEWYIASSAGG